LVLNPEQEIPRYNNSKENKDFLISSSTWLQLVLACYGKKVVTKKWGNIFEPVAPFYASTHPDYYPSIY
jgi:hypothetical protein